MSKQACTISGTLQSWPAQRVRTHMWTAVVGVLYISCLFCVLGSSVVLANQEACEISPQLTVRGCQQTDTGPRQHNSTQTNSSAPSNSGRATPENVSQSTAAETLPSVVTPLNNHHFGISGYTFLGEWKGHAYQAAIHIRPVCRNSTKHMRVVTSMTTAPHPYFRPGRSYHNPVTPTGWFSPGEGGMPEIWFTDYKTGSKVSVRHHVEEQEVDGHFMFDDDWFSQCWLSSADLKGDRAYTLSIQGSERSYQAVAQGPCPAVHPMFFRGPLSAAAGPAAVPSAAAAAVAPAPAAAAGAKVTAGAASDESSAPEASWTYSYTPIWTAPVQMEVSNMTQFTWVVRQHLDYHLRLGMSGMWMMCDPFVCLELLQDSVLAQRAAEGRLMLWSWEHGNEVDKPAAHQKVAMVLMRTAAYGTPTLLDFRDFDEFLVIPSGQSVQQLLAPGGCLSDIREVSQALITSQVTVAPGFASSSQSNSQPSSQPSSQSSSLSSSDAGELSAWMQYGVWVEALRALNYSSAPQAFYGWKAIVDPNFDYNFICHDHAERRALLNIPQVNMVDDSCAFKMHFVNWYKNRVTSGSIGGIKGDLVPLDSKVLDGLDELYHQGPQGPQADNSESANGPGSCHVTPNTGVNRSCALKHGVTEAEAQSTCLSLKECHLSPAAADSTGSILTEKNTSSAGRLHTGDTSQQLQHEAASRAGWPPAFIVSALARASDLVASYGSTELTAQALRLHGKLISVTVVTRSAEILIGAALQSVAPSVDACLLVYSSSIPSIKLTLWAAGQAVGDKLIVQEVPSGALAAMLDCSLSCARQLGASWALLIGPDQQLMGPRGLSVADEVARAADAGVSQVNCFSTHLEYAQPFLVDLTSGGSYVHDLYVQQPGLRENLLPGCVISRPNKMWLWTQRRPLEALQAISLSESELAAALEPDSEISSEAGVASGILQAAQFVKAEALLTLGRHQEASEAYQACAEGALQSPAFAALCFWRWSHKAANQQETARAISTVMRLLEEPQARSPELLWLAAYNMYQAGDYEQAKMLALQAIDLGCFSGECVPEGRMTSQEARFDRPFDVLHFALLRLGDTEGAAQAAENCELAKDARLAAGYMG